MEGMSTWLLSFVALAYLYTGIEQGYKVDWNWLGVWSCYAGANYFFIKLALNGTVH
jgi:hypothetical protein